MEDKVVSLSEFKLGLNTQEGQYQRLLHFKWLEIFITTRPKTEREARVYELYGEFGVRDPWYRLMFGLDREEGTPEQKKKAYLGYFQELDADRFLEIFEPLFKSYFNLQE